MSDLDVVVVNYNAGEYLLRCVASVYERSGGADVDVIVVDNDSHDGSAGRAEAFFPQMRLIRNLHNRGFGAAANQGIVDGSGEWILLLNPDAEISAGDLASLLAYARAHPRAGAIGVLVRDPDGTLYPSARRVPSLMEATGHALVGPFKKDNRWSYAYTMGDWDRTSERSVDWVSGSSMLLRRSVIDKVGGFDPGFFMYAEDADLCARIREAGYEVRFTPIVEVVHDHGLSTRGSKRMVWEHSRSIYRYFDKHYAKGWRRVLLPPAKAVMWLRAAIVSRSMWRS